MERRGDHFPLFNSLRGLAALSVIALHLIFQPAVGNGELRSLWPWLLHLDICVATFFTISGFLLYRPFVMARLRGRPMRNGVYAWRRIIRIVPSYWIALFLIAVVWLRKPEVVSPEGVLRYFGFLQTYWDDSVNGGLAQAWTLACEVVFYAMLPVVAVLLHRLTRGSGDPGRVLRTEAVMIGLVTAFGLAWVVALLVRYDPASRDSLAWAYSAPAYVATFAVGMALAVISAYMSFQRRAGAPVHGWMERLDRIPAGAYWAVAGAGWLLTVAFGSHGSPEKPVTDFTYAFDYALTLLVVGCLIAPAVFGDQTVSKGLVRRFLRVRFIAWVGMVSYSLYLYHYALLVLLVRHWAPDTTVTPTTTLGWLGWAACAYAGSLALGGLGYYLVERPFLRMKGFVRRDPPAPGAEPPAAEATDAGVAPPSKAAVPSS